MRLDGQADAALLEQGFGEEFLRCKLCAFFQSLICGHGAEGCRISGCCKAHVFQNALLDTLRLGLRDRAANGV